MTTNTALAWMISVMMFTMVGNKFPAQSAQAGWKPALLNPQSAGLLQAEQGFQPRSQSATSAMSDAVERAARRE
jgi:hypothetical protein